MKEFHSFLELATHLGEVVLAQHEMQRHALDKATKVVQRRAKEKIGEYQEQAGPFIAWPELADSTKADRLRLGFSENDPLLRTGGLRDSIERKVVDNEGHVGSNSDVAVYQELGTERIPPRSFLGGAVVDEIDKICEIVGDGAVTALVGNGVFGGRMAIKE